MITEPMDSSYVGKILSDALGARPEKHPVFDEVRIGLSMDRYFSYWVYSEGSYEIDDDTWGLYISAPKYCLKIIEDVAAALLATGLFVKQEVDFSAFA